MTATVLTYRVITGADPVLDILDPLSHESAPKVNKPTVIGSGFSGPRRARLACSHMVKVKKGSKWVTTYDCLSADLEEQMRYFHEWGMVSYGWVCLDCGHFMFGWNQRIATCKGCGYMVDECQRSRDMRTPEYDYETESAKVENPRLKSPVNVRFTIAKMCATCRYIKEMAVPGWSRCARPNGPHHFGTEMTEYETVCDRWAASN